MNPGPHNEYTYPYITGVKADSPAARVGLVVGDTILAVDGRDGRNAALFPADSAGTRHVIRVAHGTVRELVYFYAGEGKPPAR